MVRSGLREGAARHKRGSCGNPWDEKGEAVKEHRVGVFHDCHWKVYIPCVICGTHRWVEERQINKISAKSKGSSICRKCQSKKLADAYKTHGSSRPGSKDYDLYCIWFGMRNRCDIVTSKDYKNYGGRGITVCKEWSNFENFKSDMYPRPDGKSIDRIDNDGNYSKENCRWATKKEQSNNQRTNVRITIGDKTQTLMQWVREYGCKYSTVHYRINNSGMPPEKALMRGITK